MRAHVRIAAGSDRRDAFTRRFFLLHALFVASLWENPLWAYEGSARATRIGPVRSVLEYEVAIRAAGLRNRFAVVDVGADWCEFCAILDDRILADPRVEELLNKFAFVRVDVTSMNKEARELLSHLSVDGPPTLFIVETDSAREYVNSRSVGPFDVEDLARRLRRVAQGGVD